MWLFLPIIIWIMVKDQWIVASSPIAIHFPTNSTVLHAKATLPRNLAEYHRPDNESLVERWQDLILANVIGVNYLNSLMVLASEGDFSFTTPYQYSVKYLQNSTSFQHSIFQLITQISSTLTDARKTLNRVHTGLDHVPEQLKTITTLVKEASFDLLVMVFPDSFDEIASLVDNSLVVLQKPANDFTQVLNILDEMDYLLTFQSNHRMISLQVSDVKTQWKLLTKLITDLAKEAETVRQILLLQFKWILEEFIRVGQAFPNRLRAFIISLLLPKMIEIDHTSDLLSTITKAYTDISHQFIDKQIGTNAHLLFLSNNQDRHQYLNQFRHDLPPQVVQTARLALKRHKEFLRRNENRRANYEVFLNDTSNPDSRKLIG